MNCDNCKHYCWYYDKCSKWNCKVDAREVHQCFESTELKETLMQNEIKYHLSCPECGRTWWSEEAFPEECPYCGAERKITNESGRDKELWRDLILTAFGYIDINELIEKYPEVYEQFVKHRKL